MQEVQEMKFQSRSLKDPPEEEMATWKIPWTEEPSGLESTGSQLDMIEWLNVHS